MPAFSSQSLSVDRIKELVRASVASYSDFGPPTGWKPLQGGDTNVTRSTVDFDTGILGGAFTGTMNGTVFRTGLDIGPIGGLLQSFSGAAQVYVNGANSELIVSFRGTNTDSAASWLGDFSSYTELFSNSYVEGFTSFLEAVASYAIEFGIPSSDVHVTGHSLGGAAANQLLDSPDIADGFFQGAKYLALASPVIANSSDILNIAYDNDIVYAATDDFFVTDEGLYPSGTDNLLVAIDGSEAFNGGEGTAAHSGRLYIAGVDNLIATSFYQSTSRDDYIAVLAPKTEDNAAAKNFDARASLEEEDFVPRFFIVGNDEGNEITSSKSDDFVDGAGGNDVFVLSGSCLDYDLTRNVNGTVTITHARGSMEDGIDTLENVELARFTDTEIDLTADELFGCTVLTPVQDFYTGTTSNGLLFLEWTRIGDLSYSFDILNDGTTLRPPGAGFEDGLSSVPANLERFESGGVDLRGLTGSEDDVLIDVVYSVSPSDSPVANFVTFTNDTVRYLFIGDGVDDRGGQTFGDPHLISFDNVAYDFQAAGDFILVRAQSGPEYEVQVRFVSLSSAVSVTEAMATTIDGQTVTVEANGALGLLSIDGLVTVLNDGESVDVGSGSVSRSGSRLSLDHGNGDATTVDVFSTFINVTPQPSLGRDAGSLEGLLGNANGTPADDFQLSDGTVLSTPVPVEVLYGGFAASWLVSASDRLLPGEPESFTAPERIVTVDSLPQGLREAAESAVDALGIANPLLRDAAILDFALTGDPEFIEAAGLSDIDFNPIVDTVPIDPVSNPAIILTADVSRLAEGDATNREVTFTVSRGSTEGDLEVDYRIVGVGSAPTEAEDFVSSLTSGSVTIPDGSESASFTIEIVDDILEEGVEQFDASISLDPSQADDFEVLVSSVRIEIEDNDVTNDIRGTPSRDLLKGTDSGELIEALGGNDRVAPGLGDDEVSLGKGSDRLVGTLEDLDGDIVVDFEDVDSVIIQDLQITIDAFAFDPTTGELSIDKDQDGTSDAVLTLEGAFSDGAFMAVSSPDQDSERTTLTYEQIFPDLEDRQAVADSDVNGVANQLFLTGDGMKDFVVEKVENDDYFALYRNKLGYYTIGEDGTIGDVGLVFQNAKSADAGDGMALTDVAEGAELGFFLIKDGHNEYGRLLGDFAFEHEDTGAAGNVGDGEDLVLTHNGVALEDATVLHSYMSSLNPEGNGHVVSGTEESGAALYLGFEDLTGSDSDRDFEDVVIKITVLEEEMGGSLSEGALL